jgi:DNA-binding transcriptional regulator GbsR (MarR family)
MTDQQLTLTPSMEKFILHWGEMGSRWGINRAVAQIHALLYLSPQALSAETISSLLNLARSTVSTGLRELHSWGLIRTTHRLGDRRDYFEALEDVWEMFRIILDERKRREVDPTFEALAQAAQMAEQEAIPDVSLARLHAMLDFFEKTDNLYNQLANVPSAVIIRIAETAEGVNRLIALARKSLWRDSPN